MLTKRELAQIEHFKSENPTLKHLFDKIEQERQYERFLIAHNVRNQLTLITSSFPFIENNLPKVSDSRHWNNCVTGANGLRDFLEQLSEYYQSTTIEPKRFNLDDMLTDFVQSLPCKACPHSASVILKLHSSCPTIYGDSKKLTHALKLLLHNCCESLPQDKPTISISLSQLDTYYRITISADRPTITEDNHQKLWDSYSFDDNYCMDLPLCIANNIIRSHGGHIKPSQVQTDHGSRAKLNIYLPL